MLAPTTSNAVAGVVVLTPIFALGDTPDRKTAELPIVVAPVKSGKKPAVPVPVIAAVDAAALLVEALVALAGMEAGDANMNAEAGSPPIVSASCAFKA